MILVVFFKQFSIFFLPREVFDRDLVQWDRILDPSTANDCWKDGIR